MTGNDDPSGLYPSLPRPCPDQILPFFRARPRTPIPPPPPVVDRTSNFNPTPPSLSSTSLLLLDRRAYQFVLVIDLTRVFAPNYQPPRSVSDTTCFFVFLIEHRGSSWAIEFTRKIFHVRFVLYMYILLRREMGEKWDTIYRGSVWFFLIERCPPSSVWDEIKKICDMYIWERDIIYKLLNF